MTDDLADFLRGFHSVALAAYVAVAAETGQWPPDSEKTRRLAYDLYEAELQQKNSRAGGGGQEEADNVTAK